jgi:hypothetical protein
LAWQSGGTAHANPRTKAARVKRREVLYVWNQDAYSARPGPRSAAGPRPVCGDVAVAGAIFAQARRTGPACAAPARYPFFKFVKRGQVCFLSGLVPGPAALAGQKTHRAASLQAYSCEHLLTTNRLTGLCFRKKC